MRKAKGLLTMLLFAAVILLVGYGVIVISGEEILKSSKEPERVTMTGGFSNLFYSRMEDDIELYPWNYYQEEETDTAGIEEELFSDWLGEDGVYLEQGVLYSLIARAANVDETTVYDWYEQHDESITKSMRRGVFQGEPMNIWFYKRVLELDGREYEVKISCSWMEIISFSCIPLREEHIKETEEWKAAQERFLIWAEENQERLIQTFSNIMWVYGCMKGNADCYQDADLREYYLEVWEISMDLMENNEEDAWETNGGAEAASGILDIETEQMRKEVLGVVEEERLIQMIELSDSMLILMEGSMSVGLYYDVLDQRVTGVHLTLR